MLPQVQLTQLGYVVSVAEHRSFTGAAHALGVTQPSVSAAVRALELDLGSPLFHRARGGVTVTAAGEAFLPWARQALADAERGRAEVADLQGLRAGRLAVGATPSLSTSRLPPVLAAFHTAYPAIELVVRQAGSAGLLSDLADGLLDLALVILSSSLYEGAELTTIPLATEELVLVVAPGSPLSERKTVTPEDLAGQELVVPRPGYDLREVTLNACRAAGLEPRISVEAGELDGVLALVAAGLGAAVVPRSVVGTGRRRGLVVLRFEGGGLTRTVGLAERADRPRSSAAEAFVAELLGVRAGHD